MVESRAIIAGLSVFGFVLPGFCRGGMQALAQYFHACFEVAQGAGTLVLVAVLYEIVRVADQLQQLAAVMFAQLGCGQLQVKQADVCQFGQVYGEQRAVGADALVVATQVF